MFPTVSIKANQSKYGVNTTTIASFKDKVINISACLLHLTLIFYVTERDIHLGILMIISI